MNGDTLSKIAKDTDRHTLTISRGVEEAAEKLVENAQRHLMERVFPLVTELWEQALKAEITKVKDGKELDWKLVDKLTKGMGILERPAPLPSPLQPQPLQLGDGIESLAGFVATRSAPPRIGEGSTQGRTPVTETIDVEPIPQEEPKP